MNPCHGGDIMEIQLYHNTLKETLFIKKYSGTFFKGLNIQVRSGALSRAANMVVAIVAMAVGVSLLVSANNIFLRIIALREIHSYL